MSPRDRSREAAWRSRASSQGLRIGLVVGLLGAIASVGLADDPPPPPLAQAPVAAPPSPAPANTQAAAPVSFVIERITVEGVRGGSAKIVVSETLLNPGSAYTEAQLREALHRVERLPFVVEADFSLRRGSARGRHELVITVTPTWPIFFGGTLDLVRRDSAFGKPSDEAAALPEIGGRVFFGGYNEIGATVTGVRPITRDYGAFDDGALLFDAVYRHHNLFGRHVVGSLFLREPQSFDHAREFGAEIALPLSGASAVKASLTQSRVRWKACAQPCSLDESRATTSRVGVSWERDTTDDPFAPRQGSRLDSTLSYDDRRQRLVWEYDPWAPPPNPATPETRPPAWIGESDVRGWELSLGGRRYWPVLRRASLGLGARVAAGRSSSDYVSIQGVMTRSLDAELVGVPGRLGRGGTQLWWVARASAWGYSSRFDSDADSPLGFARGESRSGWARLSVGLAARGRWGIARLELSYEYQFRGHSEFR